MIRNHGVGRAVRLVEAVARKLLDEVEYPLGRPRLDPVPGGPLQELGPLLLHDLHLLLAHGAAKEVRLPQRVARQDRGALHHLFLIQDDPVGLLEHPLQKGVGVMREGPAVLAVDVLIHHPALQRAGAVHRERRDQVLEAVDAQLAEHRPHPRGLQLEDPHRVGLLQQTIGSRVVHGNEVQVRHGLAVIPDVLQCLLDDREGAEPQEVHLDQPQLLDGLHRELRDGLADVEPILRPRRRGRGLDAADGHEVRHGHRGDHDARGMLRGVAGQPLDVGGDVQHLPDPGVLLHRLT